MLKAVEVEPTRTVHRHVALDGLRGLAAYLVVVAHYIGSAFPGTHYAGQAILESLLQAGIVGVMLFFVISGYLMGELYMKTPCTLENVRAFYVKRIARVVPLFYFVVLVSVALFEIRQNVWPFYSINDVWRYLLFRHGDSILWTVPVEVQFYALFPLIWWAFSRAGSAAMLLVLIVCAMDAASWITTPVLFQAFLPYFVGGLLISIVTIPYSRLIEFLVIPAFLVLMLAMPDITKAMGFQPVGLWRSPVYMLLVPTTVLLVVNSRWAAFALGSRVATVAGMISYSVYLLHMPVHHVLRQLPIYQTSPLLFMGIAVIGTTAVSWISFRLFETPARRWISSFSPSVRAPNIPAKALSA